MIKILLVEDHTLVRQAWRNILLEQKDIRIIGEAESGSEALAFVKTTSPDIILLDMNLKGDRGSDIVPEICNILPHPRIIVVSMNAEFSFVKSMFRLGVVGYITKNASLDDLLEGIREAHKGNRYMSRDLRQLFAEAMTEDADRPTITVKEMEIIRLIARGLSNREIAQATNISEKTVEGRKTSIYKKLQVKNNVGLLKYASDNGLV